MEKGTLIEFKRRGDCAEGQRPFQLGVVARPEGKKNWVVVDQSGQSHTLHPRQFTFVVAGKTFMPSEITEFQTEAESYIDPSSLEVAWEILLEDSQSASPADLAQLLFSDQSPPLCYAAHCLLTDDRIYFKQKGDRFEPRSASQVAELQHQLEQQAKRQQEQQAFYQKLEQAIAGNTLEWEGYERTYLQALEKFAALGDEATTRATATEILSTLKRATSPDAAFQLLVDVKIWDPHQNLHLYRSKTPLQFSSSVVAAVDQLLKMPPPDLHAERHDLTSLKVYTIDDESTSEIDDGLSLEVLPDGKQRVWVHIADPSRWITLGDDLDREAQRRGTTVYLPTGMIPMFPTELSTGPMSLVQGQICCALSFGVILSAEGAIESYEIRCSQVQPTYRLTYADVDEMLELGVEAESELLALAQWAKQRQVWRKSQGAISIQMPESSIKVEGEKVDIQVLYDSSARNLVAEMMILTGEVAARYGQDNDLPLPFRHQPQPELPPEEELLQLAPGFVRYCAIRSCMPRSEVSISPARHASLGLDCYCQVTSPIRRYADLVAHFQIKAHLREEDLPFSKTDLTTLIPSVTTAAQEATLLERQTNRYWSLEYLRQHGQTIWPAMVLRWLREHENLALILLEDLGLELVMRLDHPVVLGDRLDVKVASVNPRLDRIQLQECFTASPDAAQEG
ncbi:VacB/RNase II family 3'-5' exoribonuclease [Acaryochloris sp. 'Moss Beach']|uniref:ribonuclease R family protein n=1 Tax=Acaryochloris sp. 'Moss Beach' TaxID=2740837 RepID=UPI001F4848A5|nr:ribonuclease R family protein [Acaryochloris sp. 'Moss Beach']UJB68695.1 VacB/RNase II family 3'-5' exoribonuclease [Acaryochloris sp. 'Moss Beach']